MEKKMEEKRDHKIYKYTNKVNGKVYIGRTCNSLKRRAHADGSGYKNCTYFWRAIQKYGWENFEGEIIEENLTDEEAFEKEALYMKKFDSLNSSRGYNTLEGGRQYYSDNSRKKLNDRAISEETRKKISKNHADVSGKNNPMWGRHRTEEEKEKIGKALLGKMHSDETRKKMSEKHRGRAPWNKGKKLTEEQKKNMKKPKFANRKGVICIETKMHYKSLECASKSTGIHPQSISYACRGFKETAGGYHWKWEVDPAIYVCGRKVKCTETGIIYNSVKDAAESAGVSRSALNEALRGGHFTGGFHWEYVDN